MAAAFSEDLSHGYEQCAEAFMRARNPRIGPAVVLEWSKTLPPGAAILDLGCGHGVPISQLLRDAGFALYGIDASATLLAAFRRRFPEAYAACEAAEKSTFFGRTLSLGAERYREILRDAGLATLGEARNEGENHYYFARKF